MGCMLRTGMLSATSNPPMNSSTKGKVYLWDILQDFSDQAVFRMTFCLSLIILNDSVS